VPAASPYSSAFGRASCGRGPGAAPPRRVGLHSSALPAHALIESCAPSSSRGSPPRRHRRAENRPRGGAARAHEWAGRSLDGPERFLGQREARFGNGLFQLAPVSPGHGPFKARSALARRSRETARTSFNRLAAIAGQKGSARSRMFLRAADRAEPAGESARRQRLVEYSRKVPFAEARSPDLCWCRHPRALSNLSRWRPRRAGRSLPLRKPPAGDGLQRRSQARAIRRGKIRAAVRPRRRWHGGGSPARVGERRSRLWRRRARFRSVSGLAAPWRATKGRSPPAGGEVDSLGYQLFSLSPEAPVMKAPRSLSPRGRGDARKSPASGGRSGRHVPPAV